MPDMPTALSSTAVRFHADLDLLAEKLVDAFGLRFRRAHHGLGSPLLRWLDFRMRYVESYPRPIVLSDRFPKANLPPEAQAGLQALVQRFEEGEDVNPYQGRGLILRNDTSASNDKRHTRTDLLFADWGILHFHLTNHSIPLGQYFSRPADYLAFCVVGGNGVAFLDVARHSDKEGFADLQLFQTLARNWPEYMDEFRVRQVVPAPDSTLTKKDISSLREGGVTTMYTYQGAVYFPPGGGVTSASTAASVTRAMVRVHALIDALADMADLPDGQMRAGARARGIHVPEFALALQPSGLCVVEVGSMPTPSPLIFALPSATRRNERSVGLELNDAVTPAWAVKSLCP